VKNDRSSSRAAQWRLLLHFAWEYLCHRITPRANRRAHAGRTPNGCYVLNDRYSRNTLTRHTRESGYPVRRSFAILSLALWNTGRPVKPGDDTLCTCGDLPVGLVELRGQVAPRNDVGEHRSPDGANGSARSAARRQAPRNPGLTRCRPRIAHRSIRATAACARGVICPSGGLLTGVSSLFFGFSEKYLLPPDPNQI